MLALESFVHAFNALPASVQTPARRSALETFLALGLPSCEQEEWKYTDLAPLGQLPPELLLPRAAQAVSLPETFSDGLDALNAAFAAEGLDRTITARERLVEPIVLAGGAHQRHRLRLEAQAEATLVIDLSDPARFYTVFADIEVGPGARLKLLRLSDPGSDAHRLTRLNIRLDRDAQLEMVAVDLGGRLTRHDLTVSLEGSGAGVALYGLYAPGGRDHVDNHTRIEHRAPQCSSREYFRGIARDQAKAVFNGMIRVHPGAQKTDSEQRVANLILSKGAEINAKPELEIYADDVKCAHGATFGQLDQTALFYLRSRGLPREAARALLIWTFATEVLEHISDESLRREATAHVLRRFPEGALAQELEAESAALSLEEGS